MKKKGCGAHAPTGGELSDISQAPEGLHPIRRLRAEANFLKFPFFDLARESSKFKRDVLEVRDIVPGPDGKNMEVLWQVERSVNSKFPGEFARRLHREVVERIVSDLPRPVKNPVLLGSFSEICRMLGVAPSGRSIQDVRSAFQSVFKTSVLSRSTFYSKARKSYIEDNFHLYDRVIFAGDTLPDGVVADAVYVVLGSWYLENLNASYVVPLDFTYFRQLNGAIASRMYELLHHWFFIALRNNQRVIERRYSTICSYFPLARQDALWKARKQLRDAHQQHQANGYLAALPEWRPISGTRKDWTLLYTPGQKAKDEYRRNQGRRDQEAFAPDEFQSISSTQPALLPSPGLTLPQLQRDLLKELELRGVTAGIALSLVQEYPPARIQQKLEAFDWMMSKSDRPAIKSPAGYLRTSIEKDYATPEGFVSQADRQRQAAETAAKNKAEREAEANATRQREMRDTRLETLWTALSPARQDQLREQALATLNDFARDRLRQEEHEGRKSVGHVTLQAEIFKLLEAREAEYKPTEPVSSKSLPAGGPLEPHQRNHNGNSPE